MNKTIIIFELSPSRASARTPIIKWSDGAWSTGKDFAFPISSGKCPNTGYVSTTFTPGVGGVGLAARLGPSLKQAQSCFAHIVTTDCRMPVCLSD